MEPLISGIVVCERNRTRAELYGLWLERADVTVAATTGAAVTACDEETAVVILEQRFAGDQTGELLDELRSASPLARFVETRDPSSLLPDLGADHDLVKPIFEADLRDLVEVLVLRANYHLLLRLYYQTTALLVGLQNSERTPEADRGQRERLEDRAERLQDAIREYQAGLSADDIAAVKKAVNYSPVRRARDGDGGSHSKHRPDRCAQCQTPWERADRFTRLGAHVWRCEHCGHVQTGGGSSYQHVWK